MAGGLAPARQREATALLRLMLPAVLFLNVAGIMAGALYALKRFVFPAFTAAAYNAAIVVTALLLGRRWGVSSVALGLLAGAAIQVALQWPGLRDARLRFALDRDHEAFRRIGRLYVPIALGLVVDMLSVALSYNLASRTGERGIPWMQYSATLIQFPLGLVSIAVSVAILPTLSVQAAQRQTEPFKRTLAHGLRLVLALTIPATVGLWVMARPIVGLVFEHGGFTPADTLATVAALRCHLVGLIFAAVDQPLIFAYYARKDTWTPAAVGVMTVVLYVGMALFPTLFGPLTLNGLILANSLKWAAHAFTMLFLLRREMGSLQGAQIWVIVLKASAASLVMGAGVHVLLSQIGRLMPAGLPGEIVLVGAGGLGGGLLYIGLAKLLRVEEIGLLAQVFGDWLKLLTGHTR
jgi:putative peptidoglycan lipid II flippase